LPKSRIEFIAYISFLVLAILFTPAALTWIYSGFGLASRDEVGGSFILMFVVLWPVVLIVFAAAAIPSLICFIGGSQRLRVRLLTLWASILLPYLLAAHAPSSSLASTIGILGFGLALSLPIIWSVKKYR
jgi:hypothetical protein